jgi:hypothetical protein
MFTVRFVTSIWNNVASVFGLSDSGNSGFSHCLTNPVTWAHATSEGQMIPRGIHIIQGFLFYITQGNFFLIFSVFHFHPFQCPLEITINPTTTQKKKYMMKYDLVVRMKLPQQNVKLNRVLHLVHSFQRSLCFLLWLCSNISADTCVRVKVMLFLCYFLIEHHAMKAYWGSGGIAPRIPWPRQ